MEPLGTGGIKSPQDKRDFLLSAIQGEVEIPTSYFTDISKLPIYYQGKQPSCIGHAVTWLVNYNELKDIGEVKLLSPRFVYALAKANDGIPNEDGTYYRTGLHMALKYGVCNDILYHNDISLDREAYNDATLITPLAYEDADYRRIRSYASVGTTFPALKQAIYQNGAVLLALQVDENTYTDKDGNITWEESKILPLRVPKNVNSGHAVVAYGYDENYIYWVNSWSTGWGRNGIGYIAKDYVPFIQEAWTVVDLSNEEIKKLKAELEEKIGLFQKIIDLWKKLFATK